MAYFYKIVDGLELEKVEADDIEEAAEQCDYWDYKKIDEDNLDVLGGEEYDEGVVVSFTRC